jgi:hypothetical protein
MSHSLRHARRAIYCELPRPDPSRLAIHLLLLAFPEAIVQKRGAKGREHGDNAAARREAEVSLYAWMVQVRTKWETMSYGEQRAAMWNGLADGLLGTAFLYFVWNGLTEDPYTFVFWAPFTGVALFYRYRQMQQRWKL